MKIQFLGTAAAPTWPALFDQGEYCEKIRQWKGKNIRSRSQALIGDLHLIDFNNDNFYHSIKFEIDFSQIMDVFITHSHEDHFVPYELEYLMQNNFAYNSKYLPYHLYGNEEVIKNAEPYTENDWETVVLHPYDTVTTPDGYKWTAIPACHKFNEEALNYIVEYKGKTLLYKVDSATYKDEKTWEFLSKFKFDCVVTECTFTFSDTVYADHETYPEVLKFKERLIKMNCFSDGDPFYLTHIHYITDGLNHDEMEEIVSKDNIHVAYDGLVLEF